VSGVVDLVVGRNPCRHARHRRGDACGCHLAFLKGVGCTSSSIPSVYRGNPTPRTSPSSSDVVVVSLVKVLLGI
jgi:hypothetical protein